MGKADIGAGWQPTRRALLAACAVALGGPAGTAAHAETPSGVSEWSVSDHARVRLIDAGPAPQDPTRRLVGIQIELDPAYLTYWRSPGEAGVPPTVAFTGSTGLKGATLLFPAPGRYSEGGTEAIGYKDGVLFPVLAVPDDAAKPVTLKMVLDFAICERLCLPARASATLTLNGDGTSPEADLVREALARVPAPAHVGDAGALAITAVDGKAGDDQLSVLVRFPGTDVPLLFAEAPEPWFVQADAGLWLNDGRFKYTVKVGAKPAEPAALPLRLTLVGSEGSIEVPVTLDAPPPKP